MMQAGHRTSAAGTSPSRVTRSPRPCSCTMRRRTGALGPSPPEESMLCGHILRGIHCGCRGISTMAYSAWEGCFLCSILYIAVQTPMGPGQSA